MVKKDLRTKLMNEILNGIKVDECDHFFVDYSEYCLCLVSLLFTIFPPPPPCLPSSLSLPPSIPLSLPPSPSPPSLSPSLLPSIPLSPPLSLPLPLSLSFQVIKLYAWEIPFMNIVTNVRKEELKVLQQSAYLSAATSFTWLCAPFLVRITAYLYIS